MIVLTFCDGKCVVYNKQAEGVSENEVRLNTPLPTGYSPLGKTIEQILEETTVTLFH